MDVRSRLFAAAASLALIQVVHGAIPSGTAERGGIVGVVGGLVFLVGAIVGAVGAARSASWAPRLTSLVGAGVAGGFVIYHALPIHSPLTHPYPGEGATPAAWASVVASVAVAVWAAVEGSRAGRAATGSPTGVATA